MHGAVSYTLGYDRHARDASKSEQITHIIYLKYTRSCISFIYQSTTCASYSIGSRRQFSVQRHQLLQCSDDVFGQFGACMVAALLCLSVVTVSGGCPSVETHTGSSLLSQPRLGNYYLTSGYITISMPMRTGFTSAIGGSDLSVISITVTR